MVTVFQIMHGGIDLEPEMFFTPARTAQTRGHPWKLDKPRAVSRARRRAFSIRVVDDWNSLPESIVSAESVNQFKNRLDDHWAGFQYEVPDQDIY